MVHGSREVPFVRSRQSSQRNSAIPAALETILYFRGQPERLMAYERHLVGIEKLLLHRRHVYVPTFRIAGLVTGGVGDR